MTARRREPGRALLRGAGRRLLGLLLLAWCTAALPAGAAALDEARELLARGEVDRAREALRALALAGDAQAQEALAAMALDGIGVERDAERAMPWLCLLAHQSAGGPAVVRALWFLAEYHRTGGAVPGRGWSRGERGAENPLKAYFWYRVMAEQRRLYARVEPRARALGRMGAETAARELFEGERQLVERRLERWSPAETPASPRECLELPR